MHSGPPRCCSLRAQSSYGKGPQSPEAWAQTQSSHSAPARPPRHGLTLWAERRNLFLKWKSNIFHVKAPMCNSWAARNMRGYGTHMSSNCKTTACAPGGQVYIKLMDWTQFSSDRLWWGISSALMSFLGDLSIDIMVNSMKKTSPKGSLSPQVNSKGFTSEAHISVKCLHELSAII